MRGMREQNRRDVAITLLSLSLLNVSAISFHISFRPIHFHKTEQPNKIQPVSGGVSHDNDNDTVE